MLTEVFTKELIEMGPVTYNVQVPELAEQLGLGAMDLVRLCGVAVMTAYKLIDKEEGKNISLDTCWKIYTGLKKNNITINGREIVWNDIVRFE